MNYARKLIRILIEAALLATAVGALSFLIYNTFGMLWYAYLGTPAAEKFIALHPESAATLFALAELDLVYFTAEVTLSAFAICFSIAAICRFLHICHYFYLSQGFFGKLLFWGGPLTVAVSWYIQYEYGFTDLKVTAAIVIIPTYLLFINCFTYSQHLVPELGDILKRLIQWPRSLYQKLSIEFKKLT